MKKKPDVLLPAASLVLALALAAWPAASREIPYLIPLPKRQVPARPDAPSDPSSTHLLPELIPRWSSYNFSAPNGGLLVYTVMPDGNPACASYDGRACLWGVGYAQVDFSRVRPLVCGQAHRALYQLTGYEDPKHWCSVARRLRAQ